MITVNLQQGTPEWHEFRAKHFTASDAAAMLGYSHYKTRDQLLQEKATGITEEVTPEKQRLFDRGHKTEALAREILEQELGQDLYPVTGTSSEREEIAASLDGLTLDDSIVFEHKLWSEKLAAFIEVEGDLPKTHWPQIEQQLYVSGAGTCVFVVSDGTELKRVTLEYHSQPERLKEVLQGWEQFKTDLDHYEAKPEIIEAVANPVDSLPALVVELSGAVSNTNLPAFKSHVETLLAAVPAELKTDQEFADAEAMAKAMKAGEKQLADAKKAALSRTADIEAVFRTIDDVSELLRKKRLQLEKLVKAEKDAKRLAVVKAAQEAFAQHIADLETKHSISMPAITADFGAATKGKRTLKSIQSAVNDELARAKITANDVAESLKNSSPAISEIQPKNETKPTHKSRSLGDALRTFCRTKNLGEQDATELLDIVSSFSINLNKAA